MEGPIDFTNSQATGLAELGGAPQVAMNVVADPTGTIYRRPGLTTSATLPTSVLDANGIAGVYRTIDGRTWAVGNTGPERPIFLCTGGGFAKISGAATGLRGTARPTFAETEMLLVISGGAEPTKVVLSTNVCSRLGGSPPLSTQVLANASRLLLNDVSVDKTKIRFSDVAIGTTSFAGHELWSLGGIGTSGYFTAEGRPDPTVALASNMNEVLVFGSATLQHFQPDAFLVYAPVLAKQVGCSAAYSILNIDQDFFWLNHLRKFVAGSGRGYQSLSDPIQKTLDDMSVVSDAWGMYVPTGFLDTLVWTFPTDGRTFSYQKKQGWGQWAGYSAGDWTSLGISCAHTPADGTPPIVGTSSGKLGVFSLDSSADFGTAINANVTTGYINRGTDSLKHCKNVKVSLKRGQSTSGTVAGSAILRYRDAPGAWTEVPIDLGVSGDATPLVTRYSLGIYRRRQWQFEYAGTEALGLAAVTEEFDVLSQ